MIGFLEGTYRLEDFTQTHLDVSKGHVILPNGTVFAWEKTLRLSCNGAVDFKLTVELPVYYPFKKEVREQATRLLTIHFRKGSRLLSLRIALLCIRMINVPFRDIYAFIEETDLMNVRIVPLFSATLIKLSDTDGHPSSKELLIKLLKMDNAVTKKTYIIIF